MKQKKSSHEGNTTKAGSTYTTPKKRYPKRSGSGSALFTPEKNRERLQEKQLIAKCKELGYEQDERRSFPCWCGKNKDEPNCVWLLSDGKSRGSHFFCLACTGRRPTEDWEKVCRDFQKTRRHLQLVVNNEISKLLKG